MGEAERAAMTVKASGFFGGVELEVGRAAPSRGRRVEMIASFMLDGSFVKRGSRLIEKDANVQRKQPAFLGHL
jgi:hypothetical protein